MGLLNSFNPQWKRPGEKDEAGTGEDQAILADIVRSNPDSAIRRRAAKRLKDRELLAEIARNDPDSDVRQAAAQRLKELTASVKDTRSNGQACR